jgi:hypothetical protein
MFLLTSDFERDSSLLRASSRADREGAFTGPSASFQD